MSGELRGCSRISYCHHGTSSEPSVIECVCFHCTAGHWWYCRKLQKYTPLTVQPSWDPRMEEDSVDISSNQHQFVSCGEPEWSPFFQLQFQFVLVGPCPSFIKDYIAGHKCITFIVVLFKAEVGNSIPLPLLQYSEVVWDPTWCNLSCSDDVFNKAANTEIIYPTFNSQLTCNSMPLHFQQHLLAEPSCLGWWVIMYIILHSFLTLGNGFCTLCNSSLQ